MARTVLVLFHEILPNGHAAAVSLKLKLRGIGVILQVTQQDKRGPFENVPSLQSTRCNPQSRPERCCSDYHDLCRSSFASAGSLGADAIFRPDGRYSAGWRRWFLRQQQP